MSDQATDCRALTIIRKHLDKAFQLRDEAMDFREERIANAKVWAIATIAAEIKDIPNV